MGINDYSIIGLASRFVRSIAHWRHNCAALEWGRCAKDGMQ